ncbi:MAG: outer membrane beta-barrel domain-containing protein [Kofleriaceae bacterium]|nr:outer membrane beta-barrel domain-containing protein [Kofleriaceae bacterium]
MKSFSPTFLHPSFLHPALATALLASLMVASYSSTALAKAQPDEPEMTFDEDETGDEGDPEMTFDEDETGEGDPEPEFDLDVPEPEPEFDPDGDPSNGDGIVEEVEDVAWQDIIVVVRKPFLKVSRIELQPSIGITMNDNLVQHYQFTGALNYYLTDVLAVGIEGQYYVKNFREPFDLVARQARRLPTVNKYNFGAALNFHYVPIYGKFAVLDTNIVHWETSLTAGVGFTQSEVLPRDPALQPFKNTLITPNLGIGMRFFLSKFMTVNLGIRDYIFVDSFEAASRTETEGDIAKENADSSG